MSGLRLAGVDVGGTFTDVALWDADAGVIRTHKLLTTNEDPARAITAGLTALGVAPDMVVHGTTLVTNSLIERRGAAVGLITTEGYRDVLEIADELRYDSFDLALKRPEPLVPRLRRLPVRERMGADGHAVIPSDISTIVDAGRRLVAGGAQAIAVAFFNSYANPLHEQQAVRALREHFPDVAVCASAEVSGEAREYERFSTVVANAFVQPLVTRHLTELNRSLAVPLLLMLSDGNIVTTAEATRRPIRLVESGPAAGAIAVARIADDAGWQNIMAFDMGGTTAKLSLVHNGRPQITHRMEVARVHRLRKGSGLPVRVPTVELIEIGAGGGSIAWVDSLGLLRMGPESAGSSPGPACYGRGGKKPTVTDADLYLGYLSPEGLVGGRLPLDLSAAKSTIDELAARLGIDSTETAAGIVDVVNTHMATAARIHLAEHGRDPRRYRMVAFGGAGPVHACGVAKILGIDEIVFPRDAGIASAIGMLVAKRGVEYSRSFTSRLDDPDWPRIHATRAELEAEGRNLLAEAGIGADQIQVELAADMRYVGQGHELTVAIDPLDIDRQDSRPIVESFTTEYRRRFGRSLDQMAIEVVSWRLLASAPPILQSMEVDSQVTGGETRTSVGSRQAFFRDMGSFSLTPVHQRSELTAKQSIEGPALIEEPNTTIVVAPGWIATAEPTGHLIVRRSNN